MKNILRLLIFLSCLSLKSQVNSSISFTLPISDGVQLVKDSLKDKISSLQKSSPPGHVITFFKGININAFISCKSDWYSYNDTIGWVNDYKMDNHGFTCNPMLFIEEGQPHILGGYGIWRGQALNIYFSDAEWQSIKGKNVPTNYNPNLGFYFNDSTYVLIGGRYENSFIGLDESTEDCFVVRKTGEWEKVTLQEFPHKPDVDHDYYRLITDDYIVSYTRSNGVPHVFIQELKSYRLTYTELDFSPLGRDIVALAGDSLSIITEGGVIHEFDIEQLINQGTVLDMTIHNTLWDQRIQMSIIITILLLLFRRFRNGIAIDTKPKYYETLLISESRKKLSVEELDQLFELDSLGYDATRKKRSELIKTINAYHKKMTGKELILREKDHHDKRRVIYKISS